MPSRLNGDSAWYDELLGLEFADLGSFGFDLELTGFDPGELSALVSLTGGHTGEDDAPAPDSPVSALGDVWLCGGHRLLCGDATTTGDGVEEAPAAFLSDLLGGGAAAPHARA